MVEEMSVSNCWYGDVVSVVEYVLIGIRCFKVILKFEFILSIIYF